jgi:hypothetical protein
LFHDYRDRVAFHVVYVREAHPSDGWQMPSNVEDDVIVPTPASFDERIAVADMCVKHLGIEFAALVDDFGDSTDEAYGGWPDRMYVIDRDGRIAYKGKPGPFGFEPGAVRAVLERIAGEPAPG